MLNYGRAIRIARAAVGKAQGTVAEKAGLSPSYLSQVEKEARTPSLSAIESISRALGVPMRLLTLLAADDEDLKGTNAEAAQRLGLDLIDLLRQLARRERLREDSPDTRTD